MSISKISSIPAFKGYMIFHAMEMKDGEPKGNSTFRKVDANDVLSIENRPYSKNCVLKCISNDDRKDCDEVSYYTQEDFNTVLDAYIAAKLSDGLFKVKM